MIADPTDLAAAPASQEYVATLRLKVGAEIAQRTDDDLLALAAQIATLAYGGQHAAVWELGRDLGMSDHAYSVIVHEALWLYPFALVPAPGESLA